MSEVVLDVRNGATSAALLGALIDAGASLERVETAVGRLGSGEVRLQLQTTPAGTALLLHAPQDAPTQEFWGDLRPRIALLALDDEVVATTLALLDALFAARATVHGVDPEDVDVDPFGGPDDLANAVALAAATHAVGATAVRATAIGHGTGVRHTIEGDVEMPGPVVATLLDGLPTNPLDEPVDVVDPVGAAYLAAVADASAAPPEGEGGASGRGRLPTGASVGVRLAAAPSRSA